MRDKNGSSRGRKSIPHLFADMTAALEDLHGIAVEGQAADLSADMRRALLSDIVTGIRRLGNIAERISGALEARQV
ncbi:hypothetical protein [Allosphingosinicella sp.]|uniref:hypothetical protein n=1 Tax=Allosphingosinicella sp. TaxID=2823234 RepID=UPI003782F433